MFNHSAINKYAHHAIIAVCIIAVVIFKIPHLSLPFFWDEAWVYAPAVKLMGEGLPSLMPDAIPVNYTRGHPLLFHFLASLWLKVFGNSNESLHTFALSISVALLLIVYYLGKIIFNKDVAVAATVLVSVQAVFLAQSSFLLPEMLLSVFVLLTIFCFLKEIKTRYVIAATALLLTKESGVILIASLGIWFLIDSLIINRAKFSVSVFFVNGIILSLPVLISSIYFLIQWKTYGWFFYPEHINMIDFSYSNFISSYRKVYNFLFEEQGRETLVVGFVIMFLLFFKPLPFKWRLFLSFLMVACVKVFFGAWKLPPFLTITVCAIILVLLFYYIAYKRYSESLSVSDKAIAVFYIFVLLFMLFSSVNFLSKRYLLCLIPLFTLTISYYAYISFQSTGWLFSLILSAAVLFSAYKASETKLSGDDSLSYIKVIALQKQVVSYMESQNLHDKNIHAGFLDSYVMNNQSSGFLSQDRKFTSTSEEFSDSTRYVIITNYQEDKLFDIIPNSQEFSEVQKFENDNFWAKIYQRK